MAASFDFEAPDFFTTGTVGVPGRRTFYLQAREAGSVVTLKLEKEQIRALAEYLAKLLNDLPKPEALPRDMALLEPVNEAGDSHRRELRDCSEFVLGDVRLALQPF